ncbi:hypothetical protein M1466_00365 [Candidatus Dependentiae bacterium]|nr:hypothetical protein [Candidatus Dependentiae bacterium]
MVTRIMVGVLGFSLFWYLSIAAIIIKITNDYAGAPTLVTLYTIGRVPKPAVIGSSKNCPYTLCTWKTFNELRVPDIEPQEDMILQQKLTCSAEIGESGLYPLLLFRDGALIVRAWKQGDSIMRYEFFFISHNGLRVDTLVINDCPSNFARLWLHLTGEGLRINERTESCMRILHAANSQRTTFDMIW